MYRLPAEWEHQSAALLTWPHRFSDWWDHCRADIDDTYTQMCAAIAKHQHVIIIHYDDIQHEKISKLLKDESVNLDKIVFVQAKSDDAWTRDHGPLIVKNSEKFKVLDFQFNAWGNKYPCGNDNQITQELHKQNIFPNSHYQVENFVLEGGGIEVDGHGTLLTTKSCLLSPERNPEHTQAEIETLLKSQLGVDRVFWLEHGELLGDDTDGHIDTLARFINPTTIAYVICSPEDQDHYPTLQAMHAELLKLRKRDGLAYELIPLPLPAPIYANDGQRLPATYANFLIFNGGVLLPIYNDAHDQAMIDLFTELFPDRVIYPIDSRPIIQNYGSIHCVTMQIPAGVMK